MLDAPSQRAFDQEVTVHRLRYVSQQTGWAVIEAGGEDGEPIVLVGPLGHLEQRERARIVGDWEDDARYGPQVKVREATPLPPTDADAVAVYLRRVKHVGPARAQRLIDRYGTPDVLDAIDADPPRALAAAGLRGRAAAEAAASWERLRASRRLHLLLGPHGLAYLVARLQDAYGEAAYETVSRQPYELTSVFGVGFLIADRIAAGIGLRPDSPERARAAAIHVLAEA